MRAHDVPREVETETQISVTFGRHGPLEPLEDSRHVGRRDADAVVCLVQSRHLEVHDAPGVHVTIAQEARTELLKLTVSGIPHTRRASSRQNAAHVTLRSRARQLPVVTMRPSQVVQPKA